MIAQAADEVARGVHDADFPIDVFQTGSGTSTNMNANEVIARRAMQSLGEHPAAAPIHPNDDVNMGQSSNDVIPTTIHVSAHLAVSQALLPALRRLATTIRTRAAEHAQTLKTGRTHLMDAMPLSLGQAMGGWATQVEHAATRIAGCLNGWGTWPWVGQPWGPGSTRIRSSGSVWPRSLRPYAALC